jgi:hypothetical protein
MSVFLQFLVIAASETESETIRVAEVDDWVGCDYIAERTGLAMASVQKHKAGLNDLTPVCRRPLRWRKGDVDKWIQGRNEKALRKGKKPISLVRRKRAA